MMEKYTIQQRVKIIKIYHRNAESLPSTLRALLAIYGRHNRWLNGYVNKQNMRYWLDNDPHLNHESSLQQDKITICCGLWVGGVISRTSYVMIKTGMLL